MIIENNEILQKKIGLRILGVGGQKKQKKFTFQDRKKRKLNCYAIVYLIKGNGYFETENLSKTKVTKGDIFFLFPNISLYVFTKRINKSL